MLRNLRNFFREFSICPVHTGMSLRTQTAIIENSQVYPCIHRDEPEARIFVMDIKGLPRTHRDEPKKNQPTHYFIRSASYERG